MTSQAEPTQEGPRRLLSLTEISGVLTMKRSNVMKFLVRRGLNPAAEKAQGYMWWEDDILRVKAEREADAERMAADEKRRQAALRRVHNEAPLPKRLGPSQRWLLSAMLVRPFKPNTDANRLALQRLEGRGYAEPVPNEPGLYRLTEAGREVAMQL